MNVPLEESVTLSAKYPSVIDRYFTRRYIQREGKNDTCLLYHSNKICLVTVAKSHAIFEKGSPIRKVNYKVGEKLDRSDNKVLGKKKHGGQYVDEHSILCIVECEDDSVYSIRAGVKGKLIEVNENLIENPQLLFNKAETDGYVAVVLQKLGVECNMSNSVSREEYDKNIEQ
ncbi:protein Abitram [Daphnia magna]|uniref:Protein Abitram n=1 Tax=Daphnia magna TaxID=35525 RepID=A0A0P5YLV3_9CRUS|nr:protein Abitram [Daphnia magna]XP_032785440.1 protein Abitram [Daphnia magna]KZS21019.1 UPF0436 protein [Daphnia magna]